MKRASIKGLGEDIFFGATNEPEPPKAVPLEGTSAPEPTSLRPDTPTPASPDVVTSGRPDVETPFFQTLEMPPTLVRRLQRVLRDERRIHTTVRFSPEEMAALRDLVYQLDARMGIRITRNEVMRVALHFFLEDYELRKEESLLLQVLKENDE